MDRESSLGLPRYIIEMEGSPLYRVLETLVKEPDAFVSDVLEQFSRVTSAATISNANTPLGAHPYNTWCCVIEIAKRTPHRKQFGLVDFVTQLQKTKLYDPGTGEQMKSEGYLLWTELPALGYTAADEWNAVGEFDSNAGFVLWLRLSLGPFFIDPETS